MPRFVRPAFVILLAAGALSACGKRGHLEPPPGQQQEAAQAGSAPAQGQTKLGGAKRTPIVPPKRALVIDGLLE